MRNKALFFAHRGHMYSSLHPVHYCIRSIHVHLSSRAHISTQTCLQMLAPRCSIHPALVRFTMACND